MQVDIFHGNNVRTDLKDNRVWFNNADVCAVLSLSSPHKVIDRVRENDRTIIPVIDSMGRTQEAWFINERGLIRILQTSRSPLAEPFQDWADERVEQLLSGKTVNAQGVVAPKGAELLALAVVEAQKMLEQQKQVITELAPKAQAYEQFLGATGLISIKQSADLLTEAGIPTGRNNLFKTLERMGWIYRDGGNWVPNETYKRQGLITAKTQTRPDYSSLIPGMRKVAGPKVHLTPKGLHKLRSLLLPPMGIEQVAA